MSEGRLNALLLPPSTRAPSVWGPRVLISFFQEADPKDWGPGFPLWL